MAGSRPITTKSDHDGAQAFSSSLSQSFRTGSPLAQELVARDLAECSDEEDVVEVDDHDEDSCFSEEEGGSPTLYRRPSGIAYGAARPALGPTGLLEAPVLTREERSKSRDAERSLLRDNHILPPKHSVEEEPSIFKRAYKNLFGTRHSRPRPPADEETPPAGAGGGVPTETSALLGDHPHEHLNAQWEAAVADGKIKTTWTREAKTITVYSRSLIVTFLLQYSINVASIFTVGRIGKLELGAVSREYIVLHSLNPPPRFFPVGLPVTDM